VRQRKLAASQLYHCSRVEDARVAVLSVLFTIVKELTQFEIAEILSDVPGGKSLTFPWESKRLKES
jgi:hypothetical protein